MNQQLLELGSVQERLAILVVVKRDLFKVDECFVNTKSIRCYFMYNLTGLEARFLQ